MLLTSNHTAFGCFPPQRPMNADFSHCVATQQMRTKWGNQANPGRVPAKSNKQRPQRHSRGILISSEVEQSPPLLCMTTLTQSCLGMHCVCVCVFHLACQPTAASSPPPFGLVGVNEQQAPSNCLCLTRLAECQRKKQMRRKRATPKTKKKNQQKKCDHRSCTFGQSRQESWLMRLNKFFIACNLSADVAALSGGSG